MRRVFDDWWHVVDFSTIAAAALAGCFWPAAWVAPFASGAWLFSRSLEKFRPYVPRLRELGAEHFLYRRMAESAWHAFAAAGAAYGLGLAVGHVMKAL